MYCLSGGYMVNIEKWDNIKFHYHKAKECLWCPKRSDGWYRRDDEGFYHLWQAYYLSKCEDEKRELIYARILMLMNHEMHSVSSYAKFHKFVAPAKEAYEKAKLKGAKVWEKEYQNICRTYESLEYELSKTKNDKAVIDEAHSLIEGLKDIKDFQFHDSKPIYFEHDKDSAVLILEFHDLKVKLQFEGVIDINISCDPSCDWIMDFYCYRVFHNSKTIIFDVEFYKIFCERITASVFSD